MHRIEVARVYDDELPEGRRFLVDRIWPRGIGAEQLRLAGWPKDVAPSAELRRWFGHDPGRWEEFRRRYTGELREHPDAWRPLLDAARAGDVVLLFAAKDRERNNAVVLREHLLGQG